MFTAVTCCWMKQFNFPWYFLGQWCGSLLPCPRLQNSNSNKEGLVRCQVLWYRTGRPKINCPGFWRKIAKKVYQIWPCKNNFKFSVRKMPRRMFEVGLISKCQNQCSVEIKQALEKFKCEECHIICWITSDPQIVRQINHNYQCELCLKVLGWI